MIKVNSVQTVATSKVTRNKKASSAKGKFHVDNETAVNDALHVGSPLSIGMIASLMDLQEISPQQTVQRQLQDRGKQLLTELENLREGILSGALSSAHLKELKDALHQNRALFEESSELASTVLEIEQRVAIELAKIEMSEKNT